MATLSRRDLLGRTMRLGCAAGIASGLIASARARASCATPDSEGLRASLNYVAQAPDPSQSCAHCAFFSADAGGGCGTCTILGGPSDASGHCDSWSPPS